jgi:hypothetical protein
VNKNFALRHLDNVVKTFDRGDPNDVYRVHRAINKVFHESLHVRRNVGTQSDGSLTETGEPSMPDTQMIGGVAKHVDQLVTYLIDLPSVLSSLTFLDLTEKPSQRPSACISAQPTS